MDSVQAKDAMQDAKFAAAAKGSNDLNPSIII